MCVCVCVCVCVCALGSQFVEQALCMLLVWLCVLVCRHDSGSPFGVGKLIANCLTCVRACVRACVCVAFVS